MMTKNSAAEIQNLNVNHESQPVKSYKYPGQIFVIITKNFLKSKTVIKVLFRFIPVNKDLE